MGLSVLIVDDEKVFRNFISQMSFWEKENFTLSGEAKGTEEAIQFLARKKTDVVILDVSMPGKSGVVLSELIAKKYPDIVMIAVSSYDDYDYVREILKNGAHDYILKSRLSEEFLERTLQNIENRIQKTSPWEAKRELRRRTEEWLLEGGMNPFTSDNSKKMVVLVRIELLRRYSESGQRAVMEGIGKIFEDNTEERMDVVAVCAAPDRYILIYRFYDEVSEAKMREKLENYHLLAVDSIRRIYNVSVFWRTCPPFFSDNALRSFVEHNLKQEEKTEQKRAFMAMTIQQQNLLLSAIGRRDGEAAEVIIRDIYSKIPLQGEAFCVIVTKELLDLLERISMEYQITLEFIPRDFQLYEYAKEKSRETLVANISGLYRNVLREMKEKSEEKKFSVSIMEAIRYMESAYDVSVSLSSVAAHIGVNSSYLSRIFHEETGVTFTEYLNRIRVEESKKLLEKGRPLKEIASLCGFKSYGYFLKIFKDYTKQTPKEYLGCAK